MSLYSTRCATFATCKPALGSPFAEQLPEKAAWSAAQDHCYCGIDSVKHMESDVGSEISSAHLLVECHKICCDKAHVLIGCGAVACLWSS